MLEDLDPAETREWVEALDSVLAFEGADRAFYLLDEVTAEARRKGAPVPYSATTPYLNTIPPDKEARLSPRELAIDVDRTRDERRVGAERERDRVKRMIDRSGRCRLRHLAHLGGRRVLPLRQAVDAVVEHQNVDVEVAAQDVDEMVAADRERVAVAGHDPDRQLGARRFQAGRDRGRAAVDRMEAVRVHVVREAARAADAGKEDEVLARDAEVGEDALHLGEDRVVAAAGAPADVLIGLEVLARQRFPHRCRDGTHD